MNLQNKIGRLFFLFLFLAIFTLGWSGLVQADYFSGEMQDFIIAGHQLELPIFENVEMLELQAREGLEGWTIEKPNQKVKLTSGKLYQLYNGSPKFWTVQVLATEDQSKAAIMKNRLVQQGFQGVEVISTTDLHKIIVGHKTNRQQSVAVAERLIKKGWQTWIREMSLNQTDKTLILMENTGKMMLNGDQLKLKGKVNLNGVNREGEFLIKPTTEGTTIYLSIGIDRYLAAMLAVNFPLDSQQEALAAQAIIYRTYLYSQLKAGQKNIFQINKVNNLNSIYVDAVKKTSQLVLTQNNDYYQLNREGATAYPAPRSGALPLAAAGFTVEEILDHYFKDTTLLDLSDLTESKVKYTARIAKGLILKEIRQSTWQGPRLVTVVDLDLDEPELKLKPVLAKGVIPGRDDLAEMVKEMNALAGVNGGYFHYTGKPLGLLYLQGQLISEPLYRRSSLLIGENGELSISRVGWQGEIRFSDTKSVIELAGVNRKAQSGENVIFNHYYGHKAPIKPKKSVEVVVKDGIIKTVNKIQNEEQQLIPQTGYVLQINQQDDLDLAGLKIGSKVTYRDNFRPDFQKNKIIHALGGGPQLLLKGQVEITGKEENFQPDILQGRAPRTALGITEDKHLLLATVDGRQPDFSIGMTLKEMAEFLKSLGATSAMNLDGGGSARMVIRGFTMNNPSQKRLISNGLIIND